MSSIKTNTRNKTLKIMVESFFCPALYVRKTMEYGVILGASEFKLKLYTDAAYALHANARSHTGVVVTFTGNTTGPVYCKSHMQKIVTLSSTESELVALVEGVKRLIPLSNLLQIVGVVPVGSPCLVLCDNKSVLHMIHNGEGFPGKSRHMRVRWHVVSELLDSNFIQCQHIDTNLMIADLLTKPMGGSKFREFRRTIMNCDVDGSDSEGSDDQIN